MNNQQNISPRSVIPDNYIVTIQGIGTFQIPAHKIQEVISALRMASVYVPENTNQQQNIGWNGRQLING